MHSRIACTTETDMLIPSKRMLTNANGKITVRLTANHCVIA